MRQTTEYIYKPTLTISDIEDRNLRYHNVLRLTPVFVFFAIMNTLIINFLDYDEAFISISLKLSSSLCIAFAASALYSKAVQIFIIKDTFRKYAKQKCTITKKYKTKFKTIKHLKSSEARNIKMNLVRFRERNNRTMRRRINTKKEKI